MSKFWNFRASVASSAELVLYGSISESTWYGDEVTPKQFTNDLKALGDIERLTVKINSSGGDAFAGIAIYNALKDHRAKVTVRVEGLAASIASIIAMAGDTIIMSTGSMMMIHNPWVYVSGDSNTIRKTADALDKVRDSLIDIYSKKVNSSRVKIGSYMDDETWMNAEEAVKMGFADQCDQASKVAASVRGNMAILNGLGFDLGRYAKNPFAGQATDDSVPPSMWKDDRESIENANAEPKQTEAERIAELESIRTTENSHLIDAAIGSGKTAGELAYSLLSQKAAAMNLVDSIAEAANKNRVRSRGKAAPLTPVESAAGSSSLIDAIAEAANQDRHQK